MRGHSSSCDGDKRRWRIRARGGQEEGMEEKEEKLGVEDRMTRGGREVRWNEIRREEKRELRNDHT